MLPSLDSGENIQGDILLLWEEGFPEWVIFELGFWARNLVDTNREGSCRECARTRGRTLCCWQKKVEWLETGVEMRLEKQIGKGPEWRYAWGPTLDPFCLHSAIPGQSHQILPTRPNLCWPLCPQNHLLPASPQDVPKHLKPTCPQHKSSHFFSF